MENTVSHLINAPHCYWLGEFERNGYNDSDFFCIYYDEKNNMIKCQEIGSTRYPGGTDIGELKKHRLTPEILEKARQCFEDYVYEKMVEMSKKRVAEPSIGVFETHMHNEVEAITDIRKKGSDKKFYIIPAGTKFEVIGKPTSFGTFYRNGYNKPDRKNSSIACRTLEGDNIYLPCCKLKLSDKYLLPNEVVRRISKITTMSSNWLKATYHGYDPNYMGWLSSGVRIDPLPNQDALIESLHA